MCTNPRKIIQNNEEITVKCGKCDTCKREKSQEWAIKLINESKYHKKASFITLTFDNKILLDKNSKAVKYGAHVGFVFNITESKEYFKKFIKRLRKHYKNKYISYFHIGEYGEETKRPHHHAIIFGVNFEEDRFEIEKSKSGKIQYMSKTLYDLWACGRCTVQDLNNNNTIYICQYSLKKFKNNELNKKYKSIMSFSNRSKISTKWARRNHKEIIKGYIEDSEGKKYRIPQSYKNMMKKETQNIAIKKSYLEYETKLMESLENINEKEFIENQKKKEISIRQKMKQYDKKRDF